MSTIRFLSTIGALGLAVLMSAGRAAAQDQRDSLLNAVEVRQLVARSAPGDHGRLAAHYDALAEQFAEEAARHTSMSRSFVGNPSRTLGSGMSAHCRRLADLNTQSAVTVRELAAHHRKLAAGAVSTPPADAARYQEGARARKPTNQELVELATKASTSADHRILEEYFTTLATRYATEANDHVALAQAYRGLPRSPGGAAAAAAHCDRLATASQTAAKEATAAARMHNELAGIGR
jgi:hypothetical protein